MKLRERWAPAVDAARAIVTELGIRGPDDLRKLELICAEKRAYVMWRDLPGNEKRHLLHSGRSSVIHVRASLRGTPKGRFVTAHEFAHHDLHADVDHYALLCTSEAVAASGSRFRVERHASDFASELVVPTSFALPMCLEGAVRVHRGARGPRDADARAWTLPVEGRDVTLTWVTQAA